MTQYRITYPKNTEQRALATTENLENGASALEELSIIPPSSIHIENNAAVIKSAQPDELTQPGKLLQETGKSLAKGGLQLGKNLIDKARNLAVEQTQEAVELIRQNMQAAQASKESLIETSVKQVNLADVKQTVAALKQSSPSSSSEEIAQKIVTQKIFQVAQKSTAIRLVPGEFLSLMGFEKTTLFLMQSETIFQVAEAYGLDSTLSERRDEAIAIFDRALRHARQLSLSGSLKVNVSEDMKASVPTLLIAQGLLGMVPIVGGVVNVGSDIVSFSLVVNTACQLYKTITEKSQSALLLEHDQATMRKIPSEVLAVFMQETQTKYPQRLW